MISDKWTHQVTPHKFAYDTQSNTLKQYKTKNITSNTFYKWSQNQLYASTYAVKHSPQSIQLKNKAIPGYGGFLPYVKSQNKHGKGFTPISRECFSNPQLNRNTFGLSSTGFNVSRHDFIDPSITASSHKYGKSKIQKPYPGWTVIYSKKKQINISTSADNFIDPQCRVPPTYAETDKHLQTLKLMTKTSGFKQNYNDFDGKGWNFDPVLNGPRDKTQYRVKYNEQIPYKQDIALNTEVPKTSLNFSISQNYHFSNQPNNY